METNESEKKEEKVEEKKEENEEDTEDDEEDLVKKEMKDTEDLISNEIGGN